MKILLKSVDSSDSGNMWSENHVKAVINIAVPIDNSTTLDQDMTIERVDGKWVASIALDEFPAQDTAELAADKLGKWLFALSKGVKGKNIKHLKLGDIFKAKYI